MNFQLGKIYELGGRCYRYVGITEDDTPPDAPAVGNEFETCQDCCDAIIPCECPPNPPRDVPASFLATYSGNATFDVWGRRNDGIRCCCTYKKPPSPLVLERAQGVECAWGQAFWPLGTDGCEDFLAVPCDREPEDEFCGGVTAERTISNIRIFCDGGRYVAYIYGGLYNEADPPGQRCHPNALQVARFLGPASSDPRGSYTVDDFWMRNQIRTGVCGGTWGQFFPIDYSGIGSWTIS